MLALPAAVVGLVSTLHGEFPTRGTQRLGRPPRAPVTTGSIAGHPQGSRGSSPQYGSDRRFARVPPSPALPSRCVASPAHAAHRCVTHGETVRDHPEREENPWPHDRHHSRHHGRNRSGNRCLPGGLPLEDHRPKVRSSHSVCPGQPLPTAYYWKRTQSAPDSSRGARAR